MSRDGKTPVLDKLKVIGIQEICEHLASGTSILDVARYYSVGYGTMATFISLPENADFYARAREIEADRYAEEIIEIADQATDAQIARLQVDARKWVASKKNKRKYGDHSTVDLNDVTEPKSREQLEARLAVLQAKAEKDLL